MENLSMGGRVYLMLLGASTLFWTVVFLGSLINDVGWAVALGFIQICSSLIAATPALAVIDRRKAIDIKQPELKDGEAPKKVRKAA